MEKIIFQSMAKAMAGTIKEAAAKSGRTAIVEASKSTESVYLRIFSADEMDAETFRFSLHAADAAKKPWGFQPWDSSRAKNEWLEAAEEAADEAGLDGDAFWLSAKTAWEAGAELSSKAAEAVKAAWDAWNAGQAGPNWPEAKKAWEEWAELGREVRRAEEALKEDQDDECLIEDLEDAKRRLNEFAPADQEFAWEKAIEAFLNNF